MVEAKQSDGARVQACPADVADSDAVEDVLVVDVCSELTAPLRR